MPRLRPLRKKEDIEKVPTDQPVLIEVSEEEEPSVAIETKTETPAETPKVETKTEPEPRPEPKADDDRVALQKQLDDLRRAEQIQKDALAAEQRQRQDLERRVREYQEQVAQSTARAEQSKYNEVLADLSSAQTESDIAAQEVEAAHAAMANGDTGASKALAEAIRKAGRAEARIDRLELEKAVIERQIETEKNKPPPQQVSTADPFEAKIAHLPDIAKSWLRAHPDYINDPKKNAALQHFHWVAKEEAGGEFTPAYIERLDIHLGFKKPPEQAAEDKDDYEWQPARNVGMAAPPSREAPSTGTGQRLSSTKVTLTPEERELCRINKLDEIEYAKNKLKLIDAKKNGLIQ